MWIKLKSKLNLNQKIKNFICQFYYEYKIENSGFDVNEIYSIKWFNFKSLMF